MYINCYERQNHSNKNSHVILDVLSSHCVYKVSHMSSLEIWIVQVEMYCECNTLKFL